MKSQPCHVASVGGKKIVKSRGQAVPEPAAAERCIIRCCGTRASGRWSMVVSFCSQQLSYEDRVNDHGKKWTCFVDVMLRKCVCTLSATCPEQEDRSMGLGNTMLSDTFTLRP